MRFQTPLIEARLLRRYKRFLADMRLADGREVVAHCPNPGSMQGLAPEAARCWLEPNDDPKKKLNFSWKLVQIGEALVVVDTALANRVVGEALKTGSIPALSGYSGLRAEVPYGEGSRVDFLLSDPAKGEALVEVKSVTLARDGWAEFPDSVTKRGTKHLEELTREAKAGHRAVMLYLVSRSDGTRVRIAGDIDPAYASAFDAARTAGVEMLALGCKITSAGVTAGHMLPVDEIPQSGRNRD